MTGDQDQAAVGVCSMCGGARRLVDGRHGGRVVAAHRIGWGVSPAAIPSVGAGAVARRCPGSGRLPRRVEHDR
jgi:hypothetical protein